MAFDRVKTRKMIEARGLKTKWLAEQSGIKPETLRRYLKGQGTPSAAVVKLMAMALDLKPEDLVAS